jgi:hypothetical protein
MQLTARTVFQGWPASRAVIINSRLAADPERSAGPEEEPCGEVTLVAARHETVVAQPRACETRSLELLASAGQTT